MPPTPNAVARRREGLIGEVDNLGRPVIPAPSGVTPAPSGVQTPAPSAMEVTGIPIPAATRDPSGAETWELRETWAHGTWAPWVAWEVAWEGEETMGPSVAETWAVIHEVILGQEVGDTEIARLENIFVRNSFPPCPTRCLS